MEIKSMDESASSQYCSKYCSDSKVAILSTFREKKLKAGLRKVGSTPFFKRKNSLCNSKDRMNHFLPSWRIPATI